MAFQKYYTVCVFFMLPRLEKKYFNYLGNDSYLQLRMHLYKREFQYNIKESLCDI
jgi:hypothetical protein